MMKLNQIEERLHAMRLQEDSKYSCSDYLARPPTRRGNDTIDHLCRFKMAEWCYTVIDYIKFRRETVSIAMNYLDRFLCTGCPRSEQVMNSRREYQLASMTTLFMAIKINEPVSVDINLMTELSKGVYKPSDFKKMETDILFSLNWYVNGPTAHSFAVHLLTLMQQTQDQRLSMSDSSPCINYDELLQLAAYKIELAVGEYKLMTQSPSVIATAAIWSCIEDLNESSSNLAAFQQIFFALVSKCNIQMDSLHETKDCIQQSKLGRSMKKRSTITSLLGVQTSPQTTPSTPRYSQHVQSSKEDAQHCSPICISNCNVVGRR